MIITFCLDDIASAAAAFLQAAGNKKVMAFHGQMGAGKTTFIHALCRAIGAKGTLSSPTFSIINEYPYSGGVIYHIDLYRLNQEEEAFRAGVEDCMYSGNFCLVEWPERAEGMFPPDTLHLQIEVVNEQTRIISVKL